MQCHEIESMLIDYADNLLAPAVKANVEKHLQGCENCRREVEEYKMLFGEMSKDKFEKPGPALREKFEIMLQSELNIDATAKIIKEEGETKVIAMKKTPWLLRIAASIILVAGGVLIGSRMNAGNEPVNAGQMADLKNEVKEMKEALLVTMLDNESATERIKAVNYVEEMGNPNQQIIDVMFRTMNNDKNVNVRLAALYSVAKFSNTQAVRDSLVNSLSKQTEPIMQIVLINILTERKETKAITPIREILSDKKTIPSVKDIAQKGLKLL